eukprot:12925105-Prorocentrum_lima.AAC.1
MLVLRFMRSSLNEANERCYVRPAYEKPSQCTQCTQEASVYFVHLHIAIVFRVRDVQALGVKFREFEHIMIL